MTHEILIVDDEADIRILTAGILQDEGYETREAADSTSALASIDQRCPDLVLLDIWLRGSELDGMEILEAIKKNTPDLTVVMMSGHGNIETAVAALKIGAFDFVEKPFQAERLILAVERALETDTLRREVSELRLKAGKPHSLEGTSQIIRDVRQLIDRVAPTNSRVLISGPPGCGKEIVSRMIHKGSSRANGPFVVLNCATMTPEHMEMELFGEEASADGEHEIRRQGTFERAHNGTLLLDEVADMPLETQGKIVRVLQEQVFQRVGGSTQVEVSVRVIASSTRDLAIELSQGNFREDLYYRLNVVPINVPALKEHREDIPELANYFLELSAAQTGQSCRTLSSNALATLQIYDWPGNVRELRNIIERLLIMAPGDHTTPIDVDILPAEMTGKASASDLGLSGQLEMMGLSLRDARENFEREYLLAQLNRLDGNISRTADFVGMERSALHRKLKSLGI